MVALSHAGQPRRIVVVTSSLCCCPTNRLPPPILCCLQYEREAAARGGGAFVAPAQRVTDFLAGQAPKGPLPASSYRCAPAPLLLPLVAGLGSASPASRPTKKELPYCPAVLFWCAYKSQRRSCPFLPVHPPGLQAGRQGHASA